MQDAKHIDANNVTQQPPRDRVARAQFYFLNEQWDRCAALDLGHNLLYEAYQKADAQLRQRMDEIARSQNCPQWIAAIVVTKQSYSVGHSDEEWENWITTLTKGKQWEEIWKIARIAPARWSARLLRKLKLYSWIPPEGSEREDFRNLLKLAAACRWGEDLPEGPCKILEGHKGSITGLAILPDGQQLISGSVNDNVRRWNLPDGKALEKCGRHTYHANNFAMSPDGKILATANSDSYSGCIQLSNLPSGRPIDKRLRSHDNRVSCLAFSPDGQVLASGAADNRVHLWHMPDGSLFQTLEGHEGTIRCLAFSPDGQFLATGSMDKTIRLWSVLDGKLHHILQGSPDKINYLVISPDSQILASGHDDETLMLWRIQDGTLLKTLKGHFFWLSDLAMSQDGKLLISGSADGTIRLWRLPDGRLINTLKGHISQVYRLSISPDGQLLASAGLDRMVILWSLPDGQLRHTLKGRKAAVCLTFSPDGRLLVSGEASGTIRVWELFSPSFPNIPPGQIHQDQLNWIEYALHHIQLTDIEKNWLKFLQGLAGHQSEKTAVSILPDLDRLMTRKRVDKVIAALLEGTLPYEAVTEKDWQRFERYAKRLETILSGEQLSEAVHILEIAANKSRDERLHPIADHLRAIVRVALHHLADKGNTEAQKALGRLFMAYGETFSGSISSLKYAPADDHRHLNIHKYLFYFLIRDWKSYTTYDPDQYVLTLVYQEADQNLRQRIKALTNDDERKAWLPVVVKTVDGVEFYAPRDPVKRALYFFLTEQWELYEMLDHDRRLLQAAYVSTNIHIRRRMSEVARTAGRTEWVDAVAKARTLRVSDTRTKLLWDEMAAALIQGQHWQKLWELAKTAPIRVSPRLLQNFDKHSWLPSNPEEHTDFRTLVELAAACPENFVEDDPFSPSPLPIHRESYGIEGIAMNPDATLLAISSQFDPWVTLRNLPEGNEYKRLTKGICKYLNISPDGRFLVGGDNELYVWGLPDGELLHVLEGHTSSIRRIVFSPDGQWLASGIENGTVRLWSISNGALRLTFCQYNRWGGELAFSPDSQQILASENRGDFLELWRVSDGTLLQVFKSQSSSITCFAFSADGRILAGTSGGEILLWRATDGTLLKTLKRHTSRIRQIEVSPDGKFFVSWSTDNTMNLWRLPEVEYVDFLSGVLEVTSLKISQDSRLLVAGRPHSLITLWHLPSRVYLKSLKDDTSYGPITFTTLSPNSRFLVTAGKDHTVRLWHLTPLIFMKLPVQQTTLDDLARVEDELRKDALTDPERRWLEFMRALMRWHRRFDIEVEERPKGIPGGEFDIEIRA